MPEVQHFNGLLQARRNLESIEERHEKEAKEILSQIDETRKSLEQGIAKLAEQSGRLRTHALRQRNDLTPGYLAFSSAYQRICGALSQGLKRTASMSRVLDTAKANQEESRLREADEEKRRQARAQARQIERLSLPTSDDFDLVYGDESRSE